jgi:hypothetical protein
LENRTPDGRCELSVLILRGNDRRLPPGAQIAGGFPMPLTAAITGFPKASRRAVIPCPRRTKSRTAVVVPRRTLGENSWMSAPAEKARSPAPVKLRHG